MKLWKELAFLCRFIDKWIIATPLNIWDTKFFKVWGSIYSNVLFTNENTWNLIDNTYKQLKEPDTKQDVTLDLIRSTVDWETIELEDINTYDAVWSIAWIKDSWFWISVKALQDFTKLIWVGNLFSLRHKEWYLAFICNKTWTPFIITWLYSMQKELPF